MFELFNDNKKEKNALNEITKRNSTQAQNEP